MPEDLEPPAPAESSAAPVPRPVVRTLRERVDELTARTGISARRLALVVAGLAVAIGGGWWLLRPPPPPLERTLPMASVSSGSAASGAASGGADAPAPGAVAGGETTSTTGGAARGVVAQAAGAVVRPGVYRLRSGARVDDLVRAAGGLTPGADGDRLNLAAPLADGQRVYVPKVGQEPPSTVPVDGGAPSAPAPGTTGSGVGGATSTPGAPPGPVDLNAATAEQLDALPGVGPATAKSILDYRSQHGRFRSVDELLEVRGIGDAKLADLRDLVTVGG